MVREMVSSPSQNKPEMNGATASAPSLPDINAEIYPYDVVQYLLDQAAYFHMYAVPDPQHSDSAAVASGSPIDSFDSGGKFGFDLRGKFHRFDTVVQPVTMREGLQVVQAVGESAGRFSCRWLVSPDGFEWSPGREPPRIVFDPFRSQRFIILDCHFIYGDGQDGFHCYGTGRTFPMTTDGRHRLLAGAVANIMEGFGKFEGLRGTVVFNGRIIPTSGFIGSVTCRVIDPEGKLRTEREIPSLTQIPDPDPETTFVIWRGQKRDKTQLTKYIFDKGQVIGLDTPGQLRSVQYSFTDQGYPGLRSAMNVRQLIGEISAKIQFNPKTSLGTETSPAPFQTDNDYTFFDREGRSVGTLKAIVGEGGGVVFDLKFPSAPGQPAIRFGGVGPILSGTGQFSGIQGLLSVNSAVGRGPHALSLLQMMQIIDPDGRFRAAVSTC